MTFNDHLQHLVERALASFPAADAGDIYAVSFLIGNEDDDPRQPTLTIGYNTETIKEGRDAWRGDACCGPIPTATSSAPMDDSCGCQPGCGC
ncbi:hypothetical protein OG352_38510 [Streptomyces sp. NBC_01485]|uniref:hypothetical protein n=1 Tax=Streptomyces sp. NBC_01485 TaxID=2903884 RepID=UPI002E36381B|nr:hypothetical protein [Streptomyces sp. NBC_01485]